MVGGKMRKRNRWWLGLLIVPSIITTTTSVLAQQQQEQQQTTQQPTTSSAAPSSEPSTIRYFLRTGFPPDEIDVSSAPTPLDTATAFSTTKVPSLAPTISPSFLTDENDGNLLDGDEEEEEEEANQMPPSPTTAAPTTKKPSLPPSIAPTTNSPTRSPSPKPSTAQPTDLPTKGPSQTPSDSPSAEPSTAEPTIAPTTNSPTQSPSPKPSTRPTELPTKGPTPTPSAEPTISPTSAEPTAKPSTAKPSDVPTPQPKEALMQPEQPSRATSIPAPSTSTPTFASPTISSENSGSGSGNTPTTDTIRSAPITFAPTMAMTSPTADDTLAVVPVPTPAPESTMDSNNDNSDKTPPPADVATGASKKTRQPTPDVFLTSNLRLDFDATVETIKSIGGDNNDGGGLNMTAIEEIWEEYILQRLKASYRKDPEVMPEAVDITVTQRNQPTARRSRWLRTSSQRYIKQQQSTTTTSSLSIRRLQQQQQQEGEQEQEQQPIVLTSKGKAVLQVGSDRLVNDENLKDDAQATIDEIITKQGLNQALVLADYEPPTKVTGVDNYSGSDNSRNNPNGATSGEDTETTSHVPTTVELVFGFVLLGLAILSLFFWAHILYKKRMKRKRKRKHQESIRRRQQQGIVAKPPVPLPPLTPAPSSNAVVAPQVTSPSSSDSSVYKGLGSDDSNDSYDDDGRDDDDTEDISEFGLELRRAVDVDNAAWDAFQRQKRVIAREEREAQIGGATLAGVELVSSSSVIATLIPQQSSSSQRGVVAPSSISASRSVPSEDGVEVDHLGTTSPTSLHPIQRIRSFPYGDEEDEVPTNPSASRSVPLEDGVEVDHLGTTSPTSLHPIQRIRSFPYGDEEDEVPTNPSASRSVPLEDGVEVDHLGTTSPTSLHPIQRIRSFPYGDEEDEVPTNPPTSTNTSRGDGGDDLELTLSNAVEWTEAGISLKILEEGNEIPDNEDGDAAFSPYGDDNVVIDPDKDQRKKQPTIPSQSRAVPVEDADGPSQYSFMYPLTREELSDNTPSSTVGSGDPSSSAAAVRGSPTLSSWSTGNNISGPPPSRFPDHPELRKLDTVDDDDGESKGSSTASVSTEDDTAATDAMLEEVMRLSQFVKQYEHRKELRKSVREEIQRNQEESSNFLNNTGTSTLTSRTSMGEGKSFSIQYEPLNNDTRLNNSSNHSFLPKPTEPNVAQDRIVEPPARALPSQPPPSGLYDDNNEEIIIGDPSLELPGSPSDSSDLDDDEGSQRLGISRYSVEKPNISLLSFQTKEPITSPLDVGSPPAAASSENDNDVPPPQPAALSSKEDVPNAQGRIRSGWATGELVRPGALTRKGSVSPVRQKKQSSLDAATSVGTGGGTGGSSSIPYDERQGPGRAPKQQQQQQQQQLQPPKQAARWMRNFELSPRTRSNNRQFNNIVTMFESKPDKSKIIPPSEHWQYEK